MKTQRQPQTEQQGAVSLFVVIFTALLITVITVSFMQLMVGDQQQAMYSDLSESAYDSATAGVEDAKRALLMQQDCKGGTPTGGTPSCADVESAIDSNECSTLSRLFGDGASGEVAVAQSEGDRRLEQAYTCVKVTRNTPDYLGTLSPDTTPKLVPLRGEQAFDRVVISWAMRKSGAEITLPNTDTFPVRTSWLQTYPSVLRAQLIDGRGSFYLPDFDTGGYSNALFLYPSRTTINKAHFNLDVRRAKDPLNKPLHASCVENPGSGNYACEMTIELGKPVAALSDDAFLSLTAFYNATDYKIVLKNGDGAEDVVQFDNVQPEVDSTGRANDLFRRVVSRVELNTMFNYPAAALETRHSICKTFSVTTDPKDYKSPTTQCDPEN